MEENKRIIVNQIRTPDGTILKSMHRHDYVTYTDKNGLEYMVDGGTDYLRRNVHESAPHEEITIYEDAPFEVIRENVCRGGRGKDGTQPRMVLTIGYQDETSKTIVQKLNESKQYSIQLASDTSKRINYITAGFYHGNETYLAIDSVSLKRFHRR